MASQLPVEHLFTLTLQGLGERAYSFAGPFGARRLDRARGGTVTGGALSGEVLEHLATDYGRASADGTIRALDAAVTVRSDDGAIVLLQMRGRASPAYGPSGLRVQCLMQAPEGRHGRLNGLQLVGIGREEGHRAVIEMYALNDDVPVDGADDDRLPPQRQWLAADFLLSRRSRHTPGAVRHVVAAPLGTRYLTLAEGGGLFAGPRLRGTFVPGYSWSPHRMAQQDGSPLMQYDVETLLETDDGAPVLMRYTGASSAAYRAGSWRTGVQFEAPLGPHEWLNAVQAVGYGRWAGDGAEYQVYALR